MKKQEALATIENLRLALEAEYKEHERHRDLCLQYNAPEGVTYHEDRMDFIMAALVFNE